VGLHADFDLGILGQALAAVGDDLVDVQRGFVEEAGDVLGDGFVLVRPTKGSGRTLCWGVTKNARNARI
jgi:hypothetical protein